MSRFFLIPFSLFLMTILGSCNNFSSEELELINGGDGGVMRVLKSDVPEDLAVLRKVAKPLSKKMLVSDEYKDLYIRMLYTVMSPENDGVGIAAPQVGISRRIIVVQRFDLEGEPFQVLANPEIIRYGSETAIGPEGCLSVPGLRGDVERAQEIELRYFNDEGEEKFTTVKGYTAVIFQHEIDHLNGILYSDKAAVIGNDYMETRTLEDGSKLSWIQDNAAPRLMARRLFSEASDELIESLGLEDGVPASVSVFLLEKDGKHILFDAGNGTEDSRLPAALEALGVANEDIDYIYLTHLHGDHIGGMLNGEEAVFPNAQVYMSQLEREGGRINENLLSAYEGRINLFEDGAVLPGDVKALLAVGHTPGHSVYQFGNYLIVGDILHGYELQTANPEICASFDGDKSAAIASRKMILRYAADNQLVMGGMHFPPKGFK